MFRFGMRYIKKLEKMTDKQLMEEIKELSTSLEENPGLDEDTLEANLAVIDPVEEDDESMEESDSEMES